MVDRGADGAREAVIIERGGYGTLADDVVVTDAIKFAGGVSAKDARTLAPMLYSDPSFIEAQPKGSYAAHIRGVTKSAVPLQFPFGFLERKPAMSRSERDELQAKMRDRYAVHYTELNGTEAPDEEPDPQPEDEPSDQAGDEKPTSDPGDDHGDAEHRHKH